ncbi:MAG: hypothetical protein IAF08_06220 [Rhizobacter sp.]|nr:hypothetical protein [Chlorobiales bacterium]
MAMTQKLLTLIVAAMLCTSEVKPCDFCSMATGINPYYNGKNKLLFNLLMQHAQFTPVSAASPVQNSVAMPSKGNSVQHAGHDAYASGASVDEQRRTLEISYQHHISESVMLTAVVPFYQIGVQTAIDLSVQGMGDLTVLAHYILKTKISEAVPLTWLVGAGVKLPTGNSSMKDDAGTTLDPRVQAGSGSWDLVLNTSLIAVQDEWTAAFDLFGKINTSNADGDLIGNPLAISFTLSRDLVRSNADNFALIGIAGVRVEAAGKDMVQNEVDDFSGFTTGYLNVGGQAAWQFLRFNLTALVPAVQARVSDAPREGVRLLTGLRIEF